MSWTWPTHTVTGPQNRSCDCDDCECEPVPFTACGCQNSAIQLAGQLKLNMRVVFNTRYSTIKGLTGGP